MTLRGGRLFRRHGRLLLPVGQIYLASRGFCMAVALRHTCPLFPLHTYAFPLLWRNMVVRHPVTNSHTHTHTHSDSYTRVTAQTWANCWCSSGWNCNAAYPGCFVPTICSRQINKPLTHHRYRPSYSPQSHFSQVPSTDLNQAMRPRCMDASCHFTGRLHRLATGMQLSTPTSGLFHDMEQLHNPPPQQQTFTHTYTPRHTIKLSFTNPLPYKVLLSAEERSRALLSLPAANMCSDIYHYPAAGWGRPMHRERDKRGGGCVRDCRWRMHTHKREVSDL